ncbi:hypothetical protein ANCCAN_08170 [Ancylostoma caninum]|uniref:Uncharacterized protein n=1 Tax=Ancylostoma caninum TaxID=29170 RepID=A0A368GNC4_ANCCA|nr:hypothetical protein ANCCAN_08170 [Ancylostoma caninum]
MRLWIFVTLLTTIFAMLSYVIQASSIPQWKYKAESRKSRPRLLGNSLTPAPNQPPPANNQPRPANNQPPPAANRPRPAPNQPPRGRPSRPPRTIHGRPRIDSPDPWRQSTPRPGPSGLGPRPGPRSRSRQGHLGSFSG